MNFSNTIAKFSSSLGGNSKYILYAVVLALACLVIYYAYRYLSNKYKPTYKPNSEHIDIGANGNSTNEVELMLFYVDWCTHCKTAKPEWEKVKAEYNGKIVNGYKLIFTEINCTNETPEVEKMISTYKIDGYPTIKMLKDGQIIEYDAKPTQATLIQFIQTVV
jgi:thiol-disulfide isomerase/thioredoxin